MWRLRISTDNSVANAEIAKVDYSSDGSAFNAILLGLNSVVQRLLMVGVCCDTENCPHLSQQNLQLQSNFSK